jgi:hypothetical protein
MGGRGVAQSTGTLNPEVSFVSPSHVFTHVVVDLNDSVAM